jgi:carbonic anhydrase
MAEIDAFFQANAHYAARFSNGDLPAPPRRHLAVVACMDAVSTQRRCSACRRAMRM